MRQRRRPGPNALGADMDVSWFWVSMGGLFALAGGAQVGLGLWGYLRKRPLVVTNWQDRLILMLFLGPWFIVTLETAIRSSAGTSVWETGLNVAKVGAAALLFFWPRPIPFTVIAISPDGFRQALLVALERLKLPFEIRAGQIKLTESQLALTPIVGHWGGTGYIEIKPPQPLPSARAIMRAMDEYYAVTRVELNSWPYLGLIVFGAITLRLAVAVAVNGPPA